MTNFFSGIYRANEALTAARYGLDVTGQNIANANTPGYTRQRADLVAVGSPVGVPTIHSGQVNSGGVTAIGASRLGDAVLDARMRAEHARSAQVDTVATRLADIENIFREPSDTGLADQMQDLWNAWGDVANDPGGRVPREMLIAAAESTVTMLHSKNAALDDVATAARASLDGVITSVNTAAADLAELNRKIAIGHATGANVNALLDQRDVILDDLSTMVGGVADIQANGTVRVTVGGETLVGTAADGKPPFTHGGLKVYDDGGAIGLYLTNGAGEFVAADGTVIGDSDMPTGAVVKVVPTDSAAGGELVALNTTVPHYRAMLDDVAKSLADTVNGIQTDGYDLVKTDGTGGDPMFTGVTARDIALATGFTWQQVAASGTPPAAGGPPNLDASNALSAALAGGRTDGPDAAYSSLIGDLGRASASAKRQQTTQAVITASVDTLKATSSGVSFDEEVSNMLMFQMAFQASSRVLTTLDEMLDTLINRTGVVGR